MKLILWTIANELRIAVKAGHAVADRVMFGHHPMGLVG
jgi:hypothetical protein